MENPDQMSAPLPGLSKDNSWLEDSNGGKSVNVQHMESPPPLHKGTEGTWIKQDQLNTPDLEKG